MTEKEALKQKKRDSLLRFTVVFARIVAYAILISLSWLSVYAALKLISYLLD